MKMIKHASLFKWPQNGASKMTNSTNDVLMSSSGKSNKLSSTSSSSISSTSQSTMPQQQTQKLWMHPPATLQNGHIAYLVKYFGNVEVNQPKGIEVVKESINKLKFIQPMKKSDGNKIPKVELTISVNGVAIQEPKTKKIYCQFPLHRISYCADDKTEKKFFSFIAKDVDTDKHLCFVFMSEKMSEEIILTIGQAFDLAYAKFIETSGRELEIRKQLIILQKKVCHLEEENKNLKERLKKYEPLDDDNSNTSNETNNTNHNNNSVDVKMSSAAASSSTSSLTASSPPPLLSLSSTTASTIQENGFDGLMTNNNHHLNKAAPAGASNGHNNNISGTKSMKLNSVPVPALQPPPPNSKCRTNQPINLIDVDIECNYNTATLMNNNNNNINSNHHQDNNPILNHNVKLISDLFDEDFNPRAEDNKQANNSTTTNNNLIDGLMINNNGINNGNQNVSPIDNNFGASITQEKDIFGCEPFQVQEPEDPFGMPQFNGTDLDSAIVNIDKKLAEMRDGFSQGLSADGFNLDS